MRKWEDEHDDPNTEPYTVVHIRNLGPATIDVVEIDGQQTLVNRPPGQFVFQTFFRTYTQRSWFQVTARDEVDAFMQSTKRLARNKAASDRRRAKRKA